MPSQISCIGQDDRKHFEKASRQFYSSLDKHLGISDKPAKGADATASSGPVPSGSGLGDDEWRMWTGGLRDADANLEMSQRHFHAASLDYVAKLQSVEERMSFEFIYTLSSESSPFSLQSGWAESPIVGFLYSFLSFYHVGYRIHEDFKPSLDSVVQKVEKVRNIADLLGFNVRPFQRRPGQSVIRLDASRGG